MTGPRIWMARRKAPSAGAQPAKRPSWACCAPLKIRWRGPMSNVLAFPKLIRNPNRPRPVWEDWGIAEAKSGYWLIDGEGNHIDNTPYDTRAEAERVLDRMIADNVAAEKAEAEEARFQAHRDREIDDGR